MLRTLSLGVTRHSTAGEGVAKRDAPAVSVRQSQQHGPVAVMQINSPPLWSACKRAMCQSESQLARRISGSRRSGTVGAGPDQRSQPCLFTRSDNPSDDRPIREVAAVGDQRTRRTATFVTPSDSALIRQQSRAASSLKPVPACAAHPSAGARTCGPPGLVRPRQRAGSPAHQTRHGCDGRSSGFDSVEGQARQRQRSARGR